MLNRHDQRMRLAHLMVAYSGGTAFNFVNDVPHFDTYIASQRKMAERAGIRNATVLMSNHSEFDNAVTKIKTLAARKAGEPHPFELGREAVQRYFKVTDECAQVARLKLLSQLFPLHRRCRGDPCGRPVAGELGAQKRATTRVAPTPAREPAPCASRSAARRPRCLHGRSNACPPARPRISADAREAR